MLGRGEMDWKDGKVVFAFGFGVIRPQNFDRSVGVSDYSLDHSLGPFSGLGRIGICLHFGMDYGYSFERELNVYDEGDKNDDTDD